MRLVAQLPVFVALVVILGGGVAHAQVTTPAPAPTALPPTPSPSTATAGTDATVAIDYATIPMRVGALTAGALALLVTAAMFFRGHLNWLVIGEDNRYSNSKFQMALWFWALLSGYLAAIILRVARHDLGFAGGVGIPANLLAVSGLSALTFVGAKQIVVSRIDQRGGNARAVKPPSLVGPRFPTDLVTDDSGHRPDFGDFQMLIVTLLAIGVWLASVLHWLGAMPASPSTKLPDIDTTILGTFGIGQGAYLAKKFAGDNAPVVPGPVIVGKPPRPIQGRVVPRAIPHDGAEE